MHDQQQRRDLSEASKDISSRLLHHKKTFSYQRRFQRLFRSSRPRGRLGAEPRHSWKTHADTLTGLAVSNNREVLMSLKEVGNGLRVKTLCTHPGPMASQTTT